MSRESTVLGRLVSRDLDRLELYQGTDEELLPDWRGHYDDVSDLHLAAFYGDLASVRRLTRREYNVDRGCTHGPKLLTQRHKKGTQGTFGRALVGFFLGTTPLMMACEQGHLDVIKFLTEQCMANVNAVDSLGLTPLTFAAANGHTHTVKYLLSRHAESNNPEMRFGMTPVNLASFNNHTDVVKLLLKRHVIEMIPDRLGRLPIHFAAWNYNSELVEYLNNHADHGTGVNVSDYHGNTPLHMLVTNTLGHKDGGCVYESLNPRADNSQSEDSIIRRHPLRLPVDNQADPLAYAEFFNPLFTIYEDTDREVPNRQRMRGTSPLRNTFGPNRRRRISHSSSELSGNERVFTDLNDPALDQDDTVCEKLPNISDTNVNNADVMKRNLETKYADNLDETNTSINERANAQASTSEATEHKQRANVDTILPYIKDKFERGTGDPDERYACLKTIINAGTDVNVQNVAGETALHALCSSMSQTVITSRHIVLDDYTESLNQLIMMRLLLHYGCKPDIVDYTGKTAAILCEERGNWLALEMVEKSRGVSGKIASREVDIKTVVQKFGWGRLVEIQRFKEDIDVMSTAILHGDVTNKAYKLASRLLREAMSVV